VRHGHVGAGIGDAGGADRGLGGALDASSRTGPGARLEPGDGAVLGRARDGPDDGGSGHAGPRPERDRARRGRHRLGAVAGRDGARPGDRGLDPVPDDDAARHRIRGRVRRLADAGRPADGLRGYRRAADPARGFGSGAADAAAGVLRDVRHQPVRLGDHHHPGVTAAGNLGTAAAHVLPAPYAAGAAVFALLYGVPTWGFAMMWLALAAAITVRTALRNRPGGLPFALTWWSFTFPVGTYVTGTIGLAARCHSDVLRGASVLLFALLLVAWLVVAARTVSGAAAGRLFKPVAAISRALST